VNDVAENGIFVVNSIVIQKCIIAESRTILNEMFSATIVNMIMHFCHFHSVVVDTLDVCHCITLPKQ